jgi:hypothetical protein
MKAILKDGTVIEDAVFATDGTINQRYTLRYCIPKEDVEEVILDNIEEFDKIFKPIQNPHESECFHFETYGEEYDIVLANHKANPNTVWTVVDGEDGELYVQLGLWLCDRVHYIITEEPAHWPVKDFRYCENDENETEMVSCSNPECTTSQYGTAWTEYELYDSVCPTCGTALKENGTKGGVTC